MDAEKNHGISTAAREDESSASSNNLKQTAAGAAHGEAAEIYGDVETANKLGYVQRGLKSRHMQFMALGGTIGTGLFLGIGGAFLKGGPLSVILGFSLTGIAVYAMMMGLGEMATWLPLPGAIPHYCSRYVDPALGFAMGWNQYYLSCIAICAEISAASVLIQYWSTEINPAAWISIFIPLIVLLNVVAVSVYGEAEFIFAAIKLITIVGLLLMSFIVDLGGSPTGDRLGFRYWYNPGPVMKEVVATGDAGRFLGFFSTLIYATFSYGGVEMVAVAAGEAKDPRRNIPKAILRIFWRILIFYVFGALAISVIVPSDDERLVSASPWVLGIQKAGIPILPSIINAVIITSAISSANAFLFVGSRYLFSLAQNNHAPKIFLRCTSKGVPIYALGFTIMWSGLTYLSASAGAASVFMWLISLGGVAVLFTWCCVCISFIRFRQACIAQGVDRNTLVFKSRFQPYTAYCALVYFVLILLFSGWEVFTTGNWSAERFVASYIGFVFFFCLYLGWKLWKRTPFIDPKEADIWSGKAALDAKYWPERKPRNAWEKFWFWLA